MMIYFTVKIYLEFFYDNKVVLPNKIAKKAMNSDKSGEIYRFVVNCFFFVHRIKTLINSKKLRNSSRHLLCVEFWEFR